MRFVFDPEAVGFNKLKSFCGTHPQGSIYQTVEMYQVYKRTKSYKPVFITALDSNENITGTLLASVFSERKGMAGRMTTRALISGGPLCSNQIKPYEMLKVYNEKINKSAVYTRILSITNKIDAEIIKMGYRYNERLNFIINLADSEENIWKRINNARRRQIKKSYEKGVTAVSFKNGSVNDFYQILNETYQSAGLQLNEIEFFQNADEILGKDNMLRYFSAYFEGRLIAVRIVLLYNKIIYDWFAGNLQKYTHLNANGLLVWEILKWGAENGYKEFNFGGAGERGKSYGVRDFKSTFKGSLVTYGEYFKIHSSLKYSALKTGAFAYKILKKK